MLFIDEFTLNSPVRGASKFAEEFSSRGRLDKLGRSLRQLDLLRRLFRHPCSFLASGIKSIAHTVVLTCRASVS